MLVARGGPKLATFVADQILRRCSDRTKGERGRESFPIPELFDLLVRKRLPTPYLYLIFISFSYLLLISLSLLQLGTEDLIGTCIGQGGRPVHTRAS
jgi:hypothetical protein